MEQRSLVFEQATLEESHLPSEQRMVLVELMAQMIVEVFREQKGEEHGLSNESENNSGSSFA